MRKLPAVSRPQGRYRGGKPRHRGEEKVENQEEEKGCIGIRNRGEEEEETRGGEFKVKTGGTEEEAAQNLGTSLEMEVERV